MKSLAANFVVNLLPYVAPFFNVAFQPEFLDVTHRPVDRHPCHYFRMGEVTLRPADFPDALVRLRPILDYEVDQVPLEMPVIGAVVDLERATDVHRVDHLAVDVELKLLRGSSNSLRRRSPAAPYMICSFPGSPATARNSQLLHADASSM